MIDIASLWKFDLCQGSTDHPRNGACLYDAANWILYGTVGDDPPSACPVVRAYAFRLNDMLPDKDRQRLKLFILRVIGNRDPASERARAEYLVRRITGVIAPMVLKEARRARPVDDEASAFVSEFAARAAATEAVLAEAVHADGGWQDVAEYAANAVEAALKAARTTRLRRRLYDAAIDTLGGALDIGKQADPFDVEAVELAIATFDRVRWEAEPVGIA